MHWSYCSHRYVLSKNGCIKRREHICSLLFIHPFVDSIIIEFYHRVHPENYVHGSPVNINQILLESCFNIKTVFPSMGIPMLKIRQLWDCLIFNIRIPTLVRLHLYTETPPLVYSLAHFILQCTLTPEWGYWHIIFALCICNFICH